MIKILLNGDPIAKATHRTANGRTYNPKHKLMLEVKKQMIFQKPPDFELDKAYTMVSHFYMPIARSCSQIEKNLKSWGLIEHTQRSDLSNLLKFYEDCANEVLYHDDCQIVQSSMKKKFDLHPRTEIFIEKVIMPKPTCMEIFENLSTDDLEDIIKIAHSLQLARNFNGNPTLAGLLSNDIIGLSKYHDKLRRIYKASQKDE